MDCIPEYTPTLYMQALRWTSLSQSDPVTGSAPLLRSNARAAAKSRLCRCAATLRDSQPKPSEGP